MCDSRTSSARKAAGCAAPLPTLGMAGPALGLGVSPNSTSVLDEVIPLVSFRDIISFIAIYIFLRIFLKACLFLNL